MIYGHLYLIGFFFGVRQKRKRKEKKEKGKREEKKRNNKSHVENNKTKLYKSPKSVPKVMNIYEN